MRFIPSGTIEEKPWMQRLSDRRCVQRFSSKSGGGGGKNDKTDMLMPSNNEGLCFGHLLLSCYCCVIFSFCLDNGPEIFGLMD